MAHHLLISGHPSDRKMYKALRKGYYWPGIRMSCYIIVRACEACAKERISLQTKSSPMKLFPSNGPLEDLAMYLLTKLLPSKRGYINMLIFTDRFTKMVQTIFMKATSAYQVALAFVKKWAFVHGILKSMLTENGTQFHAKFIVQVQRVLGVRHQFTSTYHHNPTGNCNGITEPSFLRCPSFWLTIPITGNLLQTQ